MSVRGGSNENGALKVIPKSWGQEEILHADANYTCKFLVYKYPIASSLHYHPNKHETFVCLSGQFRVSLGEDQKQAWILNTGAYLVIPPNTPHQVHCDAPGILVEASSFDDPNDCVRLKPSQIIESTGEPHHAIPAA